MLKSYRAIAAVQARLTKTTLMSVGDREADVYELFREAAEHPQGPKLLIRAEHNRQLQDEQARFVGDAGREAYRSHPGGAGAAPG